MPLGGPLEKPLPLSSFHVRTLLATHAGPPIISLPPNPLPINPFDWSSLSSDFLLFSNNSLICFSRLATRVD